MRFRTWHYVVIGLLSVTAVGLVFLHQWLRPYDLKTERAAARAAGVPLTAADLNIPHPPPGENAGPEWIALGAELLGRPLVFPALPKLEMAGKGPTPPEVIAARRSLTERADTITRIHRAAARPRAAFGGEYGLADGGPDAVMLRTATQTFRWESRLLARQGKFAEAMRPLELALNMGDQWAEDPSWGGAAGAIAMGSTALQGLVDILRLAGPDAAVAAEVHKALRRHPPKITVAYTLGSEAASFTEAVDDIGRSSYYDNALRRQRGLWRPLSSLRLNIVLPVLRYWRLEPTSAAHLHGMTQVYEAANMPDAERLAALERVHFALNQEARQNKPPLNMALRTIAPEVYPKRERSIRTYKARYAVTLAAARVMEFRSRTGEYPVSLAAVGGEPAVDPFTGRPLGYRREGTGFVVYSAGENGAFAAKPGQPTKGATWFRYRAARQ